MDRGPKPAKAKVEARRPAGRKPGATSEARVRALELRLAEALAQQAATSEILRVISASPSDVQPVLDAVAERAAHLCKSPFARVLLVDGDVLHCRADYSVDGGTPIPVVPVALKRTTVSGRAVVDSKIINLADIVPLLDTEFPDARNNARRTGFRACLAVPLMREAGAYGAIFLWRREPGLFSPAQVAVVETFARQVALAIDNVRLFRETKEALEQHTATGEILRAISRSPTDVKPVFETIAANALRLCDASFSVCYRFDGELIHIAALHHAKPDGVAAFHAAYPCPPSRGGITQRAILTGGVVHVADVRQDPEYLYHDAAKNADYRSVLSVPMLREGRPIGAISVFRDVPGLFPGTQVALLKTFADQAVIAVENVHLFTELDARNHDLSEALDQQSATSEVLRAIASSPTDIQPVLESVVRAAARFCGAPDVALLRIDGNVLRGAAAVGAFGDVLKGPTGRINAVEMPVTRDSVSGRAVVEHRSIHVHDLAAESEDEYPMGRELQRRYGHRTMLAVPLLRDSVAVGVIDLFRTKVEPFSDKQVELLKAFADQAVIAIENVRLFTELGARTAELTRSVGELRALGEIGQAVSSTLDLATVLSTIVSRATQLTGMDGGAIYEYDEAREEFHLQATDGLPAELVEALRSAPMRKGEGAIGRLAVTGEPVEIRDIADEGAYQSRIRKILVRLGYRSLLAVPLLREDHLLGGLVVNRKSAGEFAPHVIDLLKTFATQSALAIQNARLFREIGDQSRQLEIASRHKSEFLANMSHELRTPLNAIIGFSEVLAERMFGEINDKQAEYLADILESGRHLLSLINDILDLSKIEAGRMELDLADFDLPGAIDNTMTLVRERAHRRGIVLERNVDARVGRIRGDERKVKQVLLNLLSNALKFTPEGGRIDVRADVRDDRCEISVTDTGVGIAPGDLDAVFEEFRQVGSTAKKVEGTGLGLAISRKFIELHGGRIRATSQVGTGSTFAFTLPLVRAQGGASG